MDPNPNLLSATAAGMDFLLSAERRCSGASSIALPPPTASRKQSCIVGKSAINSVPTCKLRARGNKKAVEARKAPQELHVLERQGANGELFLRRRCAAALGRAKSLLRLLEVSFLAFSIPCSAACATQR